MDVSMLWSHWLLYSHCCLNGVALSSVTTRPTASLNKKEKFLNSNETMPAFTSFSGILWLYVELLKLCL